jgi:hypothetical protein
MGPSKGVAMTPIPAVRAKRAVEGIIAGKFEESLCKQFDGKTSAQEP